jgi:hypothetical protein
LTKVVSEPDSEIAVPAGANFGKKNQEGSIAEDRRLVLREAAATSDTPLQINNPRCKQRGICHVPLGDIQILDSRRVESSTGFRQTLCLKRRSLNIVLYI